MLDLWRWKLELFLAVCMFLRCYSLSLEQWVNAHIGYLWVVLYLATQQLVKHLRRIEPGNGGGSVYKACCFMTVETSLEIEDAWKQLRTCRCNEDVALNPRWPKPAFYYLLCVAFCFLQGCDVISSYEFLQALRASDLANDPGVDLLFSLYSGCCPSRRGGGSFIWAFFDGLVSIVNTELSQKATWGTKNLCCQVKNTGICVLHLFTLSNV